MKKKMGGGGLGKKKNQKIFHKKKYVMKLRLKIIKKMREGFSGFFAGTTDIEKKKKIFMCRGLRGT